MNVLSKIRVLDLSTKLTASLATMYLSSYGAEVTKIEMPNSGDTARSWEPILNEKSLYFNYLNSGKKSLTLDIKTEKGKEIFKKLLPNYDVICVDYEAGYMESLGLGYEDLKIIKSDIIYGSYSYFGETGPYKNKVGSSLTVQAKSVAMDMTGHDGDYPVKLGPSIGEHYGSAYLATGIVMAIIDREKRGIGQKVDISLMDSLYSSVESAPAAYTMIGEEQRRKGNLDPSCAPYDCFKTKDGYVSIGVATQNQWLSFCDGMEFDDLKNDTRFNDSFTRTKNYLSVLKPILIERLGKYTKFEIENKCRVKGVPCCAVLNIAEITDLPNTLENGYMCEFESDTFGKVRYPSVPFNLSRTIVNNFEDGPELGEHTENILKKINYDSETINELKNNNII